jgi:hypothetical protein
MRKIYLPFTFDFHLLPLQKENTSLKIRSTKFIFSQEYIPIPSFNIIFFSKNFCVLLLTVYSICGITATTNAQADPISFNSTAFSNSQINLTATANAAGDNIIVAFNTVNTFGFPSNGTNYIATDVIPAGGGTILYNGLAGSLTNHTGLSANTKYFYKAFSYDGSTKYSSGITANATTFPAPPSAIAGTALTTSGFTANWSAPTQGGEPFTYQVDYSTDNSFGSGVTTLTGISSGTLSTPITGLANGTAYYYRVYCSNASGFSTFSNVITVTTTCIAPAVPAAGDNSRCGTGTVIITATPGSGETIDWYSAASGGTLLLSGNTSFTTPTISTTTLYYAEARNTTTGCVSVSRTLVTATVNPVVVPSVSIASNSGTNICAGTSVIFTATPTNGGGSPTYKWFIGSTPISGATGVTFTTSTLVNANQVKVEMTSNATCPVPSTVTSNVITMTVNTIVIPSVTISSSATTICSGTLVTFTAATPNNGGLSPTYQWQISTNGGGSFTDIVGGNGTTYSSSVLANGNIIRLKLTSSAACASPNPVFSNEVTMNVSPPPTVADAGPDQLICATATTLAGNTAAVGTGTWTLSSGTGTITTPGSPTSGVTGLGVGANTFRWTITNAPCTASFDDVVITRSDIPTVADAGIDQSVCATTTTLAGNTATVGTGTWTLIGGTGTITSANSPTSGVTGLGVGSNTFRWTITNSPCTASIDDVVINRSATPTTADAGPDQLICATATTLAGNTATVGTGTWTLISGSGVITTPGSPTSGVTGLGVGANTFRWTITNAPCTSSTDDVVITRSNIPTVADAGIDQSVCATTTTLAGNTATVGTGTWTLIGGTGTITSPNSPTSGVTGLGVGSNTFRWSITNSPCTVSIDDVVINRSATPTTANAGPDQLICATVTTLAGNTATVGTGTWTLISGSGVITTPGSPTSGVTGLGVGANTFRWTITNAPCTASFDDVVITRSDIPTFANAGPDQSLCVSTTTTLAGNTATVGTGTWTLISGSGTITTPNSPTSAITGLGTGANTFRWTIANSPCTASFDEVIITNNQNSTISLTSVAGTDNQSRCINTAITNITYSIGGGGTGAGVAGLPSGVTGSYNSGTKVFTITGTPSVSGTFNYTVTTTGPCTNTFLSGSISVSPAIPATPSTPTSLQSTSVCPVVTGLQYNVTAVANATSYLWSLPTGWTITAGSGTNSITVTATVSAVSGNITVRSSNACGNSAASAPLTVTVGNFAFVDAGADQTVCASSPAPVVSLSPVTGGATGNNNVIWSSSNGGTFSPNANKWNADYTPGAAAIAAGTVTLTITTDDPSGSCSAVSDQLVVTIRPTPTATISATNPICSGTSTNITFNGTANTTVSYKVNAGAVQTISIDGTGTVNLNTGILSSNTTYLLTGIIYTTGISCSNPLSQSLTIVLNTPVATNAGTDQTVCASSPNVTLAGIITGGATTGTWSGGAGTFAPNNTTLNAVYTPSAAEITAGTVTLTLTSADPAGPCPATNDAMVITINPAVITNAGADQTVCGSSSNVTLAGSVTGGATTGTWSGGAGTFAPNNTTLNAVYTPSAAEITTGTVTLTLTSADPAGPCPAPNDAMVITINPAVITNAGADQTVCGSNPNVTLAGSVTGGASTGTWSGGGGTFAPNNTTLNAVYTPSAAEITAGTVTLTLTSADPAGPCPATSDAMVITINQTVITNAGADQTVCGSSSNVTLAGSVTGGATTGTWGGGGGTFAPNNTTLNAVYTPSAPEITAGTVTLTLTSADPAGSCPAINDAMVITINTTVITNAGADQTVCGSSSNVTLAGSVTGGATTGTWSGGGGTFAPNNTTLNAIYTPSAAEITTGTVTLTLTSADPAGPCPATNDAMVITINPAAVVSAGSNQTICSNTTSLMAGSFGGGATSATWATSGSSTFSNNTPTAVYTPSAADISSGTVTLTYTTDDPSGSCGSVNSSMVLTIKKAVVINTQPSNVGICASNPATLGLVASGDNLTYQWYKGTIGSGVAVANTANINGATSNVLNFVQAALTDDGLYYVIVSGASPCAAVTSNQVTLNVDQSIVITTQPVSQTVCENTPNINFSVTANAGSDPLSYQWRKNGINIPGANSATYSIPSATLADAGNYDVIINGPSGYTCSNITSTIAVFSVNANSTIALSSAAGTDAQTKCINTPITNITYAIGGGTGASITAGALPAGVTGTYNAGVFTISGTPTVSGSFSYTVTTTGPCINPSLSGTITVNANSTISLSSAAATTSQTVCINNAITDITYTIGGGGTGASITIGTLPAGVTGSYNAGVFTISGTPTVSGSFSYTVTTTGPCINPSLSGTMTVNANSTISLSSAAATTSQTVCINTAITNITYAIGGGGTGASITLGALPSGVTGTYNAGVFTISGTPTVSGSFSYTVTTTGPCINPSLSGTMTVNANSTISLSSAAATTSQTVCVNNAITNITYAIGGGSTGASITAGALPSGVTGSYNAGVFTISGTPTVSGSFSYTVTTTGPCINPSLSGTMTVNANSTISLSSAAATTSQTVCVNNAITNITYAIGGGSTGASITAGALPSGVIGSYNAGVFTISGTPTASGSFSYTVTTTGPCINPSLSGTITVYAVSVGGTLTIAGTNPLSGFTTLCPGANSGTINLNGQVGSVVKWQIYSGGAWADIAGSANLLSLSFLNLTQTTSYRALVQSGTGGCASAYSSVAVINYIPTLPSPLVTSGNTSICAGGSISLTASTGQYPVATFTGGDFSNANPPGWQVTENGTIIGFPANANNGNNQPWAETNGPKTINGTTYDNNQPGLGGKFVIASGVVNTLLETPVFSTSNMPSPILQFYQAFNFNSNSTGKIEISTNGGTSYTTLTQYTGPQNFGVSVNGFLPVSLDLTNYLNLSNVRIRFNFSGNVGIVAEKLSNWAIDGMGIFGATPPVILTWTPSSSLSTGTGSPVTASPTTTTTYTVNATSGGCPLQSSTVTVTVNPLPVVTAAPGSGGAVKVCYNALAQTIPLDYTATNLPTPATYSITWSSTPANSFAVVIDSALPVSPITVNLPAGALPGTYTGTLTLKNSNGCSNTGSPFTVTINPLPTATIAGIATVCQNAASPLITFTGANGTIPYTFTYKIGTGTNQTVTTTSGNSVTVAAPTTATGTFVYTLVSVQDASSNTCSQSQGGTATVTINDPVSIASQPVSTSFCFGNDATLTATATGTSPNYQWQISTTGVGGTWSNLSDIPPYSGVITGTLNVTSPTIGMVSNLYRLVVNGACGSVNSAAAALRFTNVWMGTTNIDWNTASNWSDGTLPSTSCATVYIPNRTNQPTLSSIPVPVITNLVIDPGATLTVTNPTVTKLVIGGSITNNGTFDATNGTLEFNGSATQTIAGSYFYTRTLKNLTVSNPNGLTVSNTLNDSLRITGTLAFGAVDNATINTGDNIILASTASGTARVADITNGGINSNNKFTGKVSVERYFPSRRSWRLFTAPMAYGGAIFDNWQNKGIYEVGKGTYVSGALATSPTGANGLDWTPLNNSSLKVGSNLTPVLNTHTETLSYGKADTADNIPYFIFVRGDRNTANYNPPNSNNTTLSSKGRLQTGSQTFTAGNTYQAYTMIGNPYASPVDFDKLGRTNLTKRFYVWDPYLNTEQGGYITVDDFDNNGIYIMTPPSPGGMNQIIQSGQAFWVETESNAAASIQFQETTKSNAATNLTAFRPLGSTPSIRANLYLMNANNNTVLIDGIYAEFDDRYNKAVDIQDALKFGNIKEMLALQRDGKNLSVERRPIIQTEDTLYLRLTKTTQRAYRFQFDPKSLDPMLTAFLEDSYTGKKTPLSTATKSVYDFVINGDAASAVANRFRIVFKQIPPPFSFKQINAYQQADNITVEWTVENEGNISKYNVEKSTDGVNYTTVNTTTSTGKNIGTTGYTWIDQNPAYGNNFYRVRSISTDGKYEYSERVLVEIIKGGSGLFIYPNPVTNGKIGIAFNNMAGGIYKARLLNALGQTVLEKQINHATGTSMENIRQDRVLVAGIYHLEVTAPDKRITTLKVIVK